jgi:hypothetical protein
MYCIYDLSNCAVSSLESSVVGGIFDLHDLLGIFDLHDLLGVACTPVFM